MASVFKKTFTKPLPENAELFNRKGQEFARWKDKGGKLHTARVTTGQDGARRVLVEASTWTAKYRNGAGHVLETATGCRSKDGAQAVLNDLLARAEKVRAGIVTAAEDEVIDHQQRPLADHIQAYEAHLKVKGTTEGHAKARKMYLDRMVDDCGFKRLRDLDRTAFEKWLSSQAGVKVSARTRNACRAAAVAFCNWCIETKRLTVNPFLGIPLANEKADPRRQRRALTEAELEKLLQTTQERAVSDWLIVRRGADKGKPVCNLRPETRQRLERTGRERA
ncbi:MAG: site-specific integrase, partial [Candidatus Hydrogenedentes bacterium]|nr:site-specific integrase [Candidatus Hydrogenedentota bacterium]